MGILLLCMHEKAHAIMTQALMDLQNVWGTKLWGITVGDFQIKLWGTFTRGVKSRRDKSRRMRFASFYSLPYDMTVEITRKEGI
jgi:hypothetical protein